jgi:hypothetical protein
MDLDLTRVIECITKNRMSVNAIINASNLDINKVSFGDIRVSKTNGSKSVPIKYNGQNFQMRIPKLQYPMGVSIKETENGTNYTMLASLRGCDSYAKERYPLEEREPKSLTPEEVQAREIGQMYNFLKDLEEKVIRTAVEKSVSWFGRARKEDVLRDSMKTLVSPSVEKQGAEWVPNGKYPPSFRMKVPVYDGKVNMDAVDMANRPIPLSTDNLETVFPKRMEARFIVSLSIYVSGQGFGVTWRISYAQVSAQAKVTAAQLFDAEEDAEEEEEVKSNLAERLEEAAEESAFVPESPSAPAVIEVKAAPPAPAKASKRRVVGAAI